MPVNSTKVPAKASVPLSHAYNPNHRTQTHRGRLFCVCRAWKPCPLDEVGSVQETRTGYNPLHFVFSWVGTFFPRLLLWRGLALRTRTPLWWLNCSQGKIECRLMIKAVHPVKPSLFLLPHPPLFPPTPTYHPVHPPLVPPTHIHNGLPMKSSFAFRFFADDFVPPES